MIDWEKIKSRIKETTSWLPVALAIFVALLALVTFVFYQENSDKAASTAKEAENSAATDMTNWKTYSDTALGYAIQYPDKLKVTFATVDSVVFAKTEEDHWVYQIDNDLLEKSFEAYVSGEKSVLEAEGLTVTQTEFATTSGLQGSRLAISNAGDYGDLKTYFKLGTRVLIIRGDSANLAEYDLMVKSLIITDETATWKTYSNDTYGFSFKYPNDWTIDKAQDGAGKDVQFEILKNIDPVHSNRAFQLNFYDSITGLQNSFMDYASIRNLSTFDNVLLHEGYAINGNRVIGGIEFRQYLKSADDTLYAADKSGAIVIFKIFISDYTENILSSFQFGNEKFSLSKLKSASVLIDEKSYNLSDGSYSDPASYVSSIILSQDLVAVNTTNPNQAAVTLKVVSRNSAGPVTFTYLEILEYSNGKISGIESANIGGSDLAVSGLNFNSDTITIKENNADSATWKFINGNLRIQ